MCEFDKPDKTFASDLYLIYKRSPSAAHVLSITYSFSDIIGKKCQQILCKLIRWLICSSVVDQISDQRYTIMFFFNKLPARDSFINLLTIAALRVTFLAVYFTLAISTGITRSLKNKYRIQSNCSHRKHKNA